MSSEPDTPPELGPEASEALTQFKDGIRRARRIVREARQAIGHAPPEGAVLPPEPEDDPEKAELIIPPIQPLS